MDQDFAVHIVTHEAPGPGAPTHTHVITRLPTVRLRPLLEGALSRLGEPATSARQEGETDGSD